KSNAQSCTCAKCTGGVYGADQACQAMGQVYHDSCFTCCAFYDFSGRVFCEEDYLVCGLVLFVNYFLNEM
uniref:LIM zinc-binding domain-containing protein n=1 Tax=Sinocyclocheilus grahami TaxID=75366 RepID=A0A672KA93_SINGR